MNEIEQALLDKFLEGLHELELKLVKEVGEIKGDIQTLGQKGTNEHEALRETVERNISMDTDRLNAHSKEIDALKEHQAVLLEWKESVNRSINNRVAIIGGGLAVVAVFVAWLLDKI